MMRLKKKEGQKWRKDQCWYLESLARCLTEWIGYMGCTLYMITVSKFPMESENYCQSNNTK